MRCDASASVALAIARRQHELDILDAEHRARGAPRVVVTDQDERRAAAGEAQDKVAGDPLKDLLDDASAQRQERHGGDAEGKVFLTVHVPPPRLVITGAVHISQALAPIARAARL